jgi:hypothetical protein
MRRKSAAEVRQLQTALGSAISAWSGIEAELCGLFAFAVCNGKNMQPAVEAFCAVRSAEVQLAMTSAAIMSALYKRTDELAHWDELKKRIDKLRERRNKLAHGQIVRVESGEKYSVDFLPFYHFNAARDMFSHEHWTAKDLTTLSKAFKATTQDLWNFHHALLRHEKPPQLSPAPNLQLGRGPSRVRL